MTKPVNRPHKTPTAVSLANLRPGGGRPKGVPNKLTISIKQAIQDTFDQIGGVPALVTFAEKNPVIFYTQIWVKLLPLQVAGEGGGAIQVQVLRYTPEDE